MSLYQLHVRHVLTWYTHLLGMIDCVVAGQILSAVSDNSMSVVVGIIIVAIIAWAITTFGYQIFHYYERWAWLPQLIVLCILAGLAGPQFNISSESHEMKTQTLSLAIASASSA
jgi:purine-cytosine permease-like protein